MHTTEKNPPKALLVGVQLLHETDLQHTSSMEELARLVDTLGFEVVGSISQKRSSLCAATVLGQGKLKQIASWTGGTGIVSSPAEKSKRRTFEKDEKDDEGEGEADEASPEPSSEEGVDAASSDVFNEGKPRATILVVNNDISPTQLRNLHTACDVEVLDRTGVIIEIFSRHARSREARLQVEIARLAYNAPRLRITRGMADRQGGGIGAKGSGETAHELDRRRIRDRIAELQKQLEVISKDQDHRRQRRSEAQTVALVGYTNAGKSSLMRALTGSELYIADKLFATLDTTVRIMQPETKPRILVTDTVGFIKHLPHDLVASFRSTLDEARFASLILHVIDASDPNFREQLQVTHQVLTEIEAGQERMLVFNKRDRLTEEERVLLSAEYPRALFLSAHDPGDVDRLKEKIRIFFEGAMQEDTIHVPYRKSQILTEIHTHTRVLHTAYDEEGTLLTVRGPAETLEKLHERLQDLH